MTTENNGRRIKSVDNTFQILRQIGESGPITISELAECVNLSPGTVHTHLTTLEQNGFIQSEGKKYKLGMEFIPFSERVRSQSILYQAGKKEVDKLAHEFNAVAHLVTEYNGKLLILYETFGEDAVGKQLHTKKRNQPQKHMHCTAAGKVILAFLPKFRVKEVIEKDTLIEYTSNTITDVGELYAELDQIRDQRYAVNNAEVVHGNRGIGAPVVQEGGEVVGAISISGPTSSWRNEQFEDQLVESVIRSANNIEIKIHTMDTSL